MDTEVMTYDSGNQSFKDEVFRTICSKCFSTRRSAFQNISLLSQLRQNLNGFRWKTIACIFIFLNCHTLVLSETVAPSTTLANSDTVVEASFSTYVEDENSDVPKAVITVAGLLVFFVAAFSLAKLIDYCHDRRAIRDDASDISDYTKELLKAQMMMMAFSRGRSKGKKLKPKEAALKFGKMWRAKVARNKARLMKVKREAVTEALAQGKDPEKEAAKAVAEFEEKRIINQHNALNVSKPPIKPAKKEAEVAGIKSDGKVDNTKVDKSDDKVDKTKVDKTDEKEHQTKLDKPIQSEKPPLPPIKGRDSAPMESAKLFIVSETHSEQKGKPDESSNSKTKKPPTRTSSRPISAGLKSRPVSAKSVKSRKIFANLGKK